MLQQTVASQISRENLGCPVVYGNMQVIKDGGYEQEQVSQPISARQLDCSGGNGARAGVARCARTLQSCFTHLYFPHDYLHVATCKVTNPNDYYSKTDSRAIPNLLLCCLGFTDPCRPNSKIFPVRTSAYRSAQPCAKMVSHPLASSKEAWILQKAGNFQLEIFFLSG